MPASFLVWAVLGSLAILAVLPSGRATCEIRMSAAVCTHTLR